MGIGRMLQTRELRKDFQAIKSLSEDEKADLRETTKDLINHIQHEIGLPVEEILDSESYHPVTNAGWGQVPSIVNTRLRIPFIKSLNSSSDHPGDYINRIKYYGISLILYSTRAVLDCEFNQNNKQLHMCQNLWHEVFSNEPSTIPRRFRPNA